MINRDLSNGDLESICIGGNLLNTKVYVMSHKAFTKPKDSLYVPMHVGRALGEELGYLPDNTGDNISEKNRNYCELTGLYWLWKNATDDIIGICHYRRYFVKDEEFITKEYIEKVLQEYDVIVPTSKCTQYKNIYEHYAQMHNEKDMNICKEVLLEKYPEYEQAFDLCMNTNISCWANMIITKKKIFDTYCEWLFDILFEVERRVDISSYDTFQARIYGYLSERLLRVWLLKNSYKVREEEARMIDPAEADNAEKRIALVYKQFELTLFELTREYQMGHEIDFVDNSPLEVDFHGKIPVFVCWWQGFDEAPELVRRCIESIDRNIPADLAEVHLITLENVGLYITLPEWVIDKFEKGLISMTHLSDILRVGLLYRYGGMWMDATYFVTAPISRAIFEREEFFTLRTRQGLWRADIVQGRWACNCMYAPKHHVLFRYMLNAFYSYWYTRDSLIDYYMIDYLMALAYDHISGVKEMVDHCEYSNPHCFELIKQLNWPYRKTVFDGWCKDTNIFKLSYKVSAQKENLVGQKTIYGYLMDGEG